ncbi:MULTISPECIES: phage baseplate upper protein [Bacillus]|uniref:phage baseplate upper protein n=1 Tax=Bacillus TaxID=1386 RepID=UPI0028FBAA76|nr:MULTISPECIES: phage baseplate upper protein [Bacillus]MDU0071764.1 phage baseplate upper protein [Bacillus sp. IG6]MED8019925.1 phage baseplate upper protein [Bacillus glycinifermentans]
MIYKDSSVQFDVNSQTKRIISVNIQYSTQDIGTAKITFKLTKDGEPLPISNATHGKLFMRMADGSEFYVNTEVGDAFEGVLFYVLTDDQIKHAGTVTAELYVSYDNGQSLSVHKFSFEIDKALIDANIAPLAEYYIEDFEDLKADINKTTDEINQTLNEIKAKFDEFENIETKAGAQAKADAAEANAKAYTDLHAAKTDNPHKVTKSQVGLANVDNVKQAAKTDFDTHVADNVRHITADERTKWNGSQLFKITNDVGGVLVSIGDTDDFYTKIIQSGRRFGTFYSTGKATNAASTNSTRGVFHMTSTDSNGQPSYGYVIAIDWQNNMFTNYLDPNLGWQGWRRVLTSSDLSPTWNSVTLINGAKQDSVYPLKFSVSNNVLWLRGSFGTLPTIGTSVAKFTNKPTQTVDFVVPTIGSYGTARFALTTDGDLRYDGMLANDSASVSRVSFNIGIPLW